MKKLLVFAIVIQMAGPACSQQAQQKEEIMEVVTDTASLFTDLRVLSADSMEGRLTGSEGSRKAIDYIVSRFESIGLTAYTPGYRQEFMAKGRNHKDRSAPADSVRGVNLLGFIPGYSDSVIVISAHYDHVGIIDSLIYNGADDNASGVAVMLAIAEYFVANKPEHTLIFAAFDAEEAGLQGSRYFTNSLAVDLSRIVLNINMDMVSQNTKGEIYAAGTRYSPFLKDYLSRSGEISGIKIRFGHDGRDGLQDWTRSSDHGPFHQAGLPFVYFGVEDHPYYHKATDTYEQVPLPFFQSSATLILQSVIHLDKGLASKRLE